MSIIRQAERRRYAAISSDALNDSRLSFRARGLLGYLLSKPAKWRCESERIAMDATEGRDAVRTALRELEAAGYLFREKQRIEGGRFSTEVVVFESPTDRAEWLQSRGKGLENPPAHQDGFPVPGLTCDNAANGQVAPATDPPTPVQPTPDSPSSKKTLIQENPPVGSPNGPNADEPKRRGTQLPIDWAPDAALVAWCGEKFPGVDPTAETDQFADYHRAKGDTARDWRASWRTWIRNAHRWSSRRGPTQPTPIEFAPDPIEITLEERAEAAVAYCALQVRDEFGSDLLFEGALHALEQNPNSHVADVAIGAELYAESHTPVAP